MALLFFSGVFPEADKDPVIQIGAMVIRQGEAEPFARTIFTLKECAPIVGTKVQCFDKEIEMLEVSASFLQVSRRLKECYLYSFLFLIYLSRVSSYIYVFLYRLLHITIINLFIV